VLLTSDPEHHTVSEAGDSAGPALCEVAHYASEWPWLPVAADLLCRDLGARVQVAVSARRTDPWTWHVGSRPRSTEAMYLHRADSSAD
jgi:putative NIF3 family GTP cyclohydrolase 1 type 2